MVLVSGFSAPSFWQRWILFLFPIVFRKTCDWSHWLRLVLLVIFRPLELDYYDGYLVCQSEVYLLFIWSTLILSLWHSYVYFSFCSCFNSFFSSLLLISNYYLVFPFSSLYLNHIILLPIDQIVIYFTLSMKCHI